MTPLRWLAALALLPIALAAHWLRGRYLARTVGPQRMRDGGLL